MPQLAAGKPFLNTYTSFVHYRVKESFLKWYGMSCSVLQIYSPSIGLPRKRNERFMLLYRNVVHVDLCSSHLNSGNISAVLFCISNFCKCCRMLLASFSFQMLSVVRWPCSLLSALRADQDSRCTFFTSYKHGSLFLTVIYQCSLVFSAWIVLLWL